MDTTKPRTGEYITLLLARIAVENRFKIPIGGPPSGGLTDGVGYLDDLVLASRTYHSGGSHRLHRGCDEHHNPHLLRHSCESRRDTTCCIIGLGWGRASRAITLTELAIPSPGDEPEPNLTTGALADPSTEEDEPADPTMGELVAGEAQNRGAARRPPSVRPIGEEDIEELTADSLFDPAATSRIVILRILTPSLSVVGS